MRSGLELPTKGGGSSNKPLLVQVPKKLMETSVLPDTSIRVKRTLDGNFKANLTQEQEMKLLLEQANTTPHCVWGGRHPIWKISKTQLTSLFIWKVNLLAKIKIAYRFSTNTFMLASALWDRYVKKVMVVVDTEDVKPINLDHFGALVAASLSIAFKVVETSFPNLKDLKSFLHDKVEISTIIQAEQNILQILQFDISIVTAADVADKLCSFANATTGNQIHPIVMKSLEMLSCNQKFQAYSAADLATGAMLYAGWKQHISDDELDFIPMFMRTTAAVQCKEDLFKFITKEVTPILDGKHKSQG